MVAACTVRFQNKLHAQEPFVESSRVSLMLVKKFPGFYGTRSFITVFTTARHLYHILSQINPVHAIPTDLLSSILILPPSMPTSSKWLLSLTFPSRKPVCTSLYPMPARHTSLILLCFMTQITHYINKSRFNIEQDRQCTTT